MNLFITAQPLNQKNPAYGMSSFHLHLRDKVITERSEVITSCRIYKSNRSNRRVLLSILVALASLEDKHGRCQPPDCGSRGKTDRPHPPSAPSPSLGEDRRVCGVIRVFNHSNYLNYSKHPISLRSVDGRRSTVDEKKDCAVTAESFSKLLTQTDK